MIRVHGGSGLGRCHLRQRTAGGERGAVQSPAGEAVSISRTQWERTLVWAGPARRPQCCHAARLDAPEVGARHRARPSARALASLGSPQRERRTCNRCKQGAVGYTAAQNRRPNGGGGGDGTASHWKHCVGLVQAWLNWPLPTFLHWLLLKYTIGGLADSQSVWQFTPAPA